MRLEYRSAFHKSTNLVIEKINRYFKEDVLFLQVLSQSKLLAEDISRKQKIAEDTGVRIDEARNGYKPAARHAANLFFCVSGNYN